MGLRIATNIASQEVQKNLAQETGRTEETLRKISSGSRINKAADDASGLAISQRLEATSRGLGQATRNANDAISYVQTAEGALQETSNIIVRLRELSIQSASDTLGDDERTLLNFESEQLIEEVDRIAQATEFNGAKLINGEGQGELTFHVGPRAEEENKITYNSARADSTISTLGIASFNISTREGAEEGISSLDSAIDLVSGFRAELGSVQSRLQSTVRNLQTQKVNQDNAKSVIVDADIAEEVSKLARSKVIKHAAIAALSNANDLPMAALKLIS